MVDVFDELDEQIRSERLRALARGSLPYFLAALVLSLAVVIGFWAYGSFNAGAIDKASEAYARGMDAAQKGDLNGAYAQFEGAAKGPAGYRTLALMQQAGIRLDQNNRAAALSLLDQAAKAAPDKVFADAARLKAAYLVLDSASLADITSRLTPLMAPDRPYHAQAREALALAELAAGQTAKARSDLGVLELMGDTPDTLRQRAEAVIAIIDSGTAPSLKSLVTAVAAPAIALPPGPPAPQSPAAPTGN